MQRAAEDTNFLDNAGDPNANPALHQQFPPPALLCVSRFAQQLASQATPLTRCHMESSAYIAKEAHTAIAHIVHMHTQEGSNFWGGMPQLAGMRKNIYPRGKKIMVNDIIPRTPLKNCNLPPSRQCYVHLCMQAFSHMASGSINILPKYKNVRRRGCFRQGCELTASAPRD